MTSLQAIEQAIEQLSPTDFLALQAWFSQFAQQKYGQATQIRQLSQAERRGILEAAAAQAEDDYHNNPNLTNFSAFGPEDLYGESSSSVTR